MPNSADEELRQKIKLWPFRSRFIMFNKPRNDGNPNTSTSLRVSIFNGTGDERFTTQTLDLGHKTNSFNE